MADVTFKLNLDEANKVNEAVAFALQLTKVAHNQMSPEDPSWQKTAMSVLTLESALRKLS